MKTFDFYKTVTNFTDDIIVCQAISVDEFMRTCSEKAQILKMKFFWLYNHSESNDRLFLD